jgi:tribbles-like protein
LHSYVRSKKRLRESQAVALFEQIVSAAAHCHENGVVLRDLKLRKFVFKDPERTQLKLEGLEDACVLDDDNDLLEDKHGCPAYVSPEILDTSHTYSGKAADSWSLGVMLYTMLAGRYPFHDTDASVLFTKIRRGMFTVPDNLSSRARCLIRSLLRRQPLERLTASEALEHPWFSYKSRSPAPAGKSDKKEIDQAVPSLNIEDDSLFA